MEKSKQDNFRFDAEHHQYWLNGVQIPGYSEIAEAEGLTDYSCVRPDVLFAAKKFGTAGHTMTALWDKGILNVSILDPNLAPYLTGYQKFLRRHKVEVDPEWIESPTYSKIWKYGVTPDRLAVVDGKLTVYEIKFTAQIPSSTAIQTAAQKIAIEERTGLRIKRRLGIQVLPEDFKIEPFTKIKNETIWKSAVNLYHYKKENNLLCKPYK